MNTNFDRFRVQVTIEQLLGCNDISQWKQYLEQLKQFTIQPSNQNNLIQALKSDTLDTYFKALLSLFEALYNISNQCQSWAIVKIYYSVFYLIRCHLATLNIACIKNNGCYFIELQLNNKPRKIDAKGDHKILIKALRHYDNNHFLLTNNIDIDNSKSVFEWLMEYREIVNYRERNFSEPDLKYFNYGDTGSLNDAIELYLNECITSPQNIIHPFLSDHCLLATPLYFAYKTKENLECFLGEKFLDNINMEKVKVLDKILRNARLNTIAQLSSLYKRPKN